MRGPDWVRQRRGSALHRAASAGSIYLQGTARPRLTIGKIFNRITGWFWTIGTLCCVLVGTVLLLDIMADGGATAEMQAIQAMHQMLQQMVQEQAEQRNQVNQLAAAVTASGAAVQGTQQTTEQVINEVVQQVQLTFHQENQSHQDQMNQIAQNFQTEQQQQQQQIQSIAQAVTGLHQNLTNLTNLTTAGGQHGGATASSGPGPPPGSPPPQGCPGGGTIPVTSTASGGVTAANGVPQDPGGNVGGSGSGGGVYPSIPPMPGLAPPIGNANPANYNIGGGNATGGLSPAVAYAIQQGGVDNRALGKPTTFDPNSSKVSFQDWTDHVITMCDGSMPGIYEVMEWIVNTQPRVTLDVTILKSKFPHVDGLLLDYAESNVYAILSTTLQVRRRVWSVRLADRMAWRLGGCCRPDSIL